MDEKVSMIVFFHGLQFGPLKERLVMESVANVRQLSQLTVKYRKLEEAKKVAQGAIEVHPKKECQGSVKRKPVWDRFVLALITSARKLKAYFENHPIGVVTVQPLKRILSNPAQTGRLTKWAIELSEFGITFTPRNGIKAQALADFVIECTPGNPTNDPKSMPILPERLLWALYVDEASNPKGAAVGILIHGPEESCFEYALRFQF
ncbi:hypothetical protein LIER_03994 [Lithospermum erythrorhizon]|uniref:Reverse transcriptase RNase H-like domain-containing protein n=1 Tax=Lithospermum erythrorhizon TaxID=34254 RepID=A0AAV3NZU0_LITER